MTQGLHCAAACGKVELQVNTYQLAEVGRRYKPSLPRNCDRYERPQASGKPGATTDPERDREGAGQ